MRYLRLRHDTFVIVALTIGLPVVLALIFYVIRPDFLFGPEKLRLENRNESVAAGKSSSGRLGTVDIFELRTGDCFNTSLPDEPEVIFTVKRISCEGPWQVKVNAALIADLSSDVNYPGGQYFHALRSTECPQNSTTVFWPSRDSWDLGDRVWLCLQESEPAD